MLSLSLLLYAMGDNAERFVPEFDGTQVFVSYSLLLPSMEVCTSPSYSLLVSVILYAHHVYDEMLISIAGLLVFINVSRDQHRREFKILVKLDTTSTTICTARTMSLWLSWVASVHQHQPWPPPAVLFLRRAPWPFLSGRAMMQLLSISLVKASNSVGLQGMIGTVIFGFVQNSRSSQLAISCQVEVFIAVHMDGVCWQPRICASTFACAAAWYCGRFKMSPSPSAGRHNSKWVSTVVELISCFHRVDHCTGCSEMFWVHQLLPCAPSFSMLPEIFMHNIECVSFINWTHGASRSCGGMQNAPAVHSHQIPFIFQCAWKLLISNSQLNASLGICTFSSIQITNVYEDGSVFPPKVLNLSKEDLVEKLTGYNNVLVVAVGVDYYYPHAVKSTEYLKNPSKFAIADSGASTASKQEERAPEPHGRSLLLHLLSQWTSNSLVLLLSGSAEDAPFVPVFLARWLAKILLLHGEKVVEVTHVAMKAQLNYKIISVHVLSKPLLTVGLFRIVEIISVGCTMNAFDQVTLAASDLSELSYDDFHQHFVKTLVYTTINRHAKEKEMAFGFMEYLCPTHTRTYNMMVIASINPVVWKIKTGMSDNPIWCHDGLLSIIKNLQVPWDPSGSESFHRLGGKPNLKKGGMSGTTPIVGPSYGPWAVSPVEQLPVGPTSIIYKRPQGSKGGTSMNYQRNKQVSSFLGSSVFSYPFTIHLPPQTSYL